MLICFPSFISLPVEILQREYVIGSEKMTLIAHGELHNFIDLRIFRYFKSTVYCLQTLKFLAPNLVPFRF